jgi:hypothetical protein
MRRVVIYHGNCIDGFTAAWVAWRALGDGAEYVPAKYGDPPPDVKGADLLILDFSYPRAELVAMAADAASIRVLDHHATAWRDLEGLDFCTIDLERSGAGLAWDAFNPGAERPWLVDYVEDRDLWRFKLTASESINAYVGAVPRGSFEDWTALCDRGPITVANMGEAILMRVKSYVDEMAKQARILRVAGHDVPVVNAPYINTSELVGHLAESAPFAIGWYQRGDGLYAYSLRSRGAIDVSKLAEAYGGGGHMRAAGFHSALHPDQLFRVTGQ